MPEDVNVQKSEAKKIETERGHSVSSGPTPPPSTPERKLPLKAMGIGLVCAIVLAAGVYFFAPHATKAPSEGRGSKMKGNVPVTVATAVIQSVPIEIRTTGNVQAYSTVNVVPQVGGQLMKVYFQQGQNVKKGELLFQIDPRSYKASYAQALGNVEKDAAQFRAAQANMQRDQANIGQMQANLAKDQASLAYANKEYQRYQSLVKQGAISMEQADQTMMAAQTATAQIEADKKVVENAKAVVSADVAQIETAKGTLDADRALADNARLQLEWCTIRAPMDGRTGSLAVYQGNVVTANNTTALVSIAQVEPIYVSFTIPEEYLDQVRRCLANNTLSIQALIEGVGTNSVNGTASFLENTVNTTSGTALLRAQFDNKDGRLYPGQFLDVLVTMPPDSPSVVVPASAVQTTQKGDAVYVVQDGKAVMVPIELTRTFGDFAAVGSGLKAGDVVITDGQLQVVPGVTVNIVTDIGGGGNATVGKGHGHHHNGQGSGSGGGTPPGADASQSGAALQDAGAPPDAGDANSSNSAQTPVGPNPQSGTQGTDASPIPFGPATPEGSFSSPVPSGTSDQYRHHGHRGDGTNPSPIVNPAVPGFTAAPTGSPAQSSNGLPNGTSGSINGSNGALSNGSGGRQPANSAGMAGGHGGHHGGGGWHHGGQ